jgi:hypothetical protein
LLYYLQNSDLDRVGRIQAVRKQLPNGVMRGQETEYIMVMEKMRSILAYSSPNLPTDQRKPFIISPPRLILINIKTKQALTILA